jgi:hypothetical protein
VQHLSKDDLPRQASQESAVVYYQLSCYQHLTVPTWL